MQRSALCRSWRELSNEYLLAKFGFDTAENEPFKVCPLSVYRSPRWRTRRTTASCATASGPARPRALATRLHRPILMILCPFLKWRGKNSVSKIKRRPQGTASVSSCSSEISGPFSILPRLRKLQFQVDYNFEAFVQRVS